MGSNILFSLYDKLTTSFLKIATGGLLPLYEFMGETVEMECFYVMQYARFSLSKLLYQVSALVRLLLSNAISKSAALQGGSFLGNHNLYLT